MVAVCAGELRRRRDRAHHCAPRGGPPLRVRRPADRGPARAARGLAQDHRPPRCWSGASRTSRSDIEKTRTTVDMT